MNAIFPNNRGAKIFDRFRMDDKPLSYKILFRMGLAKDEERADKILIRISIILVLIAVTIFVIKLRTPSIKTVQLRSKPPTSVQVQENKKIKLETNDLSH